MAKRRKTTKKIGGVRVQTNPKIKRDKDIPWPTALIEKRSRALELTDDVIQFAFLCGIAIGRADERASGKPRKRK